MKKSNGVFLVLIMALTIACSSSPEGENISAQEASGEVATGGTEMYALETGVIFWTGAKPTGQHNGSVNLSEASLSVENGELVSGNFTVDLNTLVDTDLTGDSGKEKLENHLKSADFFDVANHPYATFAMTKIEPAMGAGTTHNVTGDLSIKGITKSITVPAEITMDGDMISVKTPDFTINRTEWDLKYGSGTIGTLQDKLIYDEIGLAINLTARKPAM